MPPGKLRILHVTAGLFSLLCLSVAEPANAQSLIDILSADVGVGGMIDGQPVRILKGNVKIETGEMIMDADSLYQFEGRNFLQAFNIQIETGEEIIWADTLFHDMETDFSELRGRVIIQSEKSTVFSEMIDYDMPDDLAIFRDRVRFEDDDGALVADSGFYYQKLDSAVFRGNVQVSDSTQYLEADSLFMNRETGAYELYSRVFADDFEERVTFSGNYLEADSTGYRLLLGNAWMMRLNEALTDSSFVTSSKIEVFESDTASVIDAYQDVKIWSPKFQAIGDTATFRDDIEEFYLRGSPVVWQKKIQLTGPYIEAHFEDDDIRFLESYPRPFAVMQDSVTKRLNQMTGDTLHAFFKGGNIQKIRVFDNTEIIFHQKNEEGEPDGLIELFSDGPSVITFFEGDVDDFTSKENIDGTYFQESPEHTDRRLDNFSWNPELRPEKPAVKKPRLPEIPSVRPFEMPPRYELYQQQIKRIEENGIEFQ